MKRGLFRKRELTIEEQQIRSAGKRKKDWKRLLMPYLLILPTFGFLAIFAY